MAKNGSGTITLGGTNTFTGGVTINGGVLQLANAGALNSGTPNSLVFGANAPVGTKLQLNGNSVSLASLATNAAAGTVIVENANASAATLSINQATNTIFAGVIQNGTGGGALSLTKSGVGILTLSGVNTYTGNTTISAGTLQAGVATAIPSGMGTGNVVLIGGATAGILDINGFDLSINGLSGTTGAVLGKVVNNRVGTTKTVTIGSGDASTTFAGLITNNTGTGGTLNLTKTGTGTLTLSNANTYTGITGIKNGVVLIGVANALPTATVLTLGDGSTNSSGVLKLNGLAQTLAGLTNVGSGIGNSVVNGNATPVSLTLNLTANSSFGGTLGGAGTNENNFNLVKSGTGTLTLSGVNTYIGTTNINQGTLSASNLANALGGGPSAIVLGDATNTGLLSYTGTSNSFTRGFTVSAGGGEIDSTAVGQTLTIATGNVATSGAFTIGGTGNTLISSNVTGTGSLNKTGAGNLTLSGANTYGGVGGATNIRNGTVILGVNGTGLNLATTLTLGDATANTNGVLKLDGYSQTLASLLKTGNGTGNRVVGGNATLSNLTLNNSGTVTFSGILGGSGGNENNLALTKTSAGVLTLSGANTYTGGTTISAGTLAISAANNLGATAGTLNLGAGTLQATANISSSRTINLTDATSAISINTGITYTDSGVISGSGALNLTGLGNLLLSGTSNTYSGGTFIKSGVLTLGSTNALPTTTALTLGNGGGGKLVLNGFSQTLSSLTSGTGTNSIISGKSGAAAVLTVNNSSDTTFAGILGGTGANENNFALTKTGSGILTLSGANTYASTTTISAGTLRIGSATALPSGPGKGNVSIGGSGTLDVNGNSITINGLTGTGLVTTSSGVKTFTVGSNDQSSTFSGVIQDGGGTISLAKTGTGILTLSGANTYSGATTVTAGTIKIGNTLAIPSGSGKGNVALTGSLDLNGYNINLNGLSGGGGISSTAAGNLTLTVGDANQTSAYSGIIANGTATTLGLTKIGTGTLTLSGASTYTGNTNISAGTLKLAGTNALPNGSGKGDVFIDTGAFLDIGGSTAAKATINGLTGTGTITNSGAAGGFTVGSNNVTSTFNGIIQDGTGATGITKTGTGTLTLTPSTDNAFTGGVTVSGGILQAGNSNALNSAGTNTVTFSSSVVAGTKLQLNGNNIKIAGLASGSTTGSPVVENASATASTLTIQNASTFTYAGVIQDGTGGGAFSLVKDGVGTQILTGTNLYTGGTTINGGILSINKDAALGATSGALTIGAGKLQFTSANGSTIRNIVLNNAASTILVDPGITYAESGIISGSGTLNKEGTGIFQITGSANTYTGGTTITAGLVDVTTTAVGTPLGANSGTNNVAVNAGGNLSLSSTNNKGSSQTITVTSTAGALGGIGFSNTGLTQAALTGMFTDSTSTYGGVLGINSGISYNSKIDLGALGGGNWFLGSSGTGTFSGIAANLTVGTGNTYRLGGAGGSLTLSQTNVLTGANELLVGSAATNGNGTVILSGAQNFTGKTTVTGGAILQIALETSLGMVPPSTTAGQLVLNNGTLRAGNAITIDPKRGIALGPASGSGSGTLDTNGKGFTYDGIIANNGSGTGSLTKTGTGTLTLTGANTYTGATNLNLGTTNFAALNNLGAGTAINFSGGTLQWASGNTADITSRTVTTANATVGTLDIGANNVTFNGNAITGAGGITKTGSGTLTLNVANTYTGATSIANGTVKLGIVEALPSNSALTLNGGATAGILDINGLNTTVSNLAGTTGAVLGKIINSSVGTNNALTVNNTANSSFLGIIADNGGTGGTISLVKTGANTLTLGGANTYSGGTTISAGGVTISTISGGTLTVTNASAIPSGFGKGDVNVSAAGNSVLDLNGNAITINGLTGAGAVRSNVAGAASLTAGANDRTTAFTGAILNGSGIVSFGKTGTGTLTLSNTTSDYSGGTTISGGILSISNDRNVGAVPGSPTASNIVINGGTLATSVTMTLDSKRGIAVGPASGSGVGTLALTAGTTLTYGGIITDNGGTGGLTKTNTTGILGLSGANTYSGDTTISGGTLQLGNVAAIPSGSGKGNLTLSAGSILDLNNLSPTVNGLSGSGVVTNLNAAAVPVTFTAGGNDATSSFGGIIQDGNGSTAFTKIGTGTLTLGGLNTYSGDTIISGGVLQLGIASALPSGVGKGNIALNGTLDLAGFTTTVNGLSGSGNVTNSSGTAVILSAGANDQSGSFSGNLQDGLGSVGLTKIGVGTLTLSGNNTYSGATKISTGTISVGSSTALSATSTVTIGSVGFLDVNGYNVTIDGLLGTGTLNNNGASPSLLNAGVGGASTDFNGVIADGTNTIALTKSGAGTLTLTGVNTYSGTTTISNGTVSVANPGVGGNLGTASSAVILGDASNKGILSYTGNADLNFTRGFTVNAGGGEMDITSVGKTLNIQTGGIVTTGTFTVGGAGNANVSSVISGSGGFTKANTGNLVLSSVNTYTGDTTISSGILQVTNTGAIPSDSGKGNVVVNGSLDVNNLSLTVNGLSGSGIVTNSQGSPVTLTAGGNNASGNFTGVIQDGSGTMALVKTGTGILTLGGANTYSGDTTINNGNVKIGNAAAISSGAYKGNVALATSGILDLNDFDMTINGLSGSGLVTNNSGASILTLGANSQTSNFTGNIQDGLGTIGFTKTGTGALTLSGNNTFTGASTIQTGTVTLGSDTALSPGSTLIIGNAGTLDLNGRVIAIDGLAGTGALTNNGLSDVILTTGSSGGSGTFGGTINDGTGKIALTKTGVGTVTLTATNSYSGGTVIIGGTLAVTADQVLGAVPGAPAAGNIVINGGSLSASNTFTLNSNRGILIGPATGTGSGTLDVALNQTLTYGGMIADNGSGTGSLVKTGSGTLTLTNANSYTGDTAITSGTLQIGNSAAISSGSGYGNIALTGSLDLNNFDTTINGLSGTGIVTNSKSGPATLTAGANDQTSTFAGNIQDGNGHVSLVKTGNGVLTLSGSSDYTGGTVNSSGTLALASTSALGSTGTVSMNGGTLQFSAGNTVDYSSRLLLEDGKTATFDTNGQNVEFANTLTTGVAGTASFVKEGSGTLTLSASSTYIRATSVSTGSLYVNGSLGATPTTVASGATLGGDGSINGHVAVAGTITPGAEGQIGNLGLNSLDIANNTIIRWDGTLNSISQLNVTNLLELGSGSNITFLGSGAPLTQHAYVFATYGTLSGTQNTFGTVADIPVNYHIDYNYDGLNQIALVIPEPRTAMLGLIGALALLRRRRDTAKG